MRRKQYFNHLGARIPVPTDEELKRLNKDSEFWTDEDWQVYYAEMHLMDAIDEAMDR